MKKAMRQMAGIFSELEKARLVGKLKAARDRKRATGVKVEGRKNYAETNPELVELARAAGNAGGRCARYPRSCSCVRNRAEAQARAKKLAPVIRELQERGFSMRAIAAELRKRKVPTPKGGTWHPELVTRIVRRIEAA
jgi:hypothetical protein